MTAATDSVADDSKARSAESGSGPKPLLTEPREAGHHVLVYLFLLVPMTALLAAVPLAWVEGWLGWTDIALLVGFWLFTGLGVTVGFHRHFTHGAFKANKTLRGFLAVAGMMSAQGPVITWVADHRRHHAFADREGDPHSPWLYGTGVTALAKGFWHSHMGWLLNRDQTNEERFTPDLNKDASLVRLNKLFPLWTVLTFALPAVIGGLVTMSWWGAFTGFFWGGLVRVSFLHHITWSVNSICHMIGERPFKSRDKASNFWPLAILSFGESWHNLHHADPTCARHGVLKGQIDMSARVIWAFEKLGWAWKVRWSNPQRLARITVTENKG